MNYEVKIDEFEGPLDLLLYLIKQANINIWDIKIKVIAKQYLDYIKNMEQLNLNIASEYLVMAAELIEMKSATLLPKKEVEEEIEEDPREQLINRLLEYESYKQMTSVFKDFESERKLIHTKEPSYLDEFKNEEITANVDVEDLLNAFSLFLQKKEFDKPLNTKITTKEYSIEERKIEIKNIIKIKKRVEFEELFEIYNKDYIIVTFLSILDLAKKQELKIEQEKNFDKIYLVG